MTPCNCEKIAVLTTIQGERMHESDAEGVWCGVYDGKMFHPKTLIEPTQAYLDAEAARQAKASADEAKLATEQAAVDAVKTELAAIKAKLEDEKATKEDRDRAVDLLIKAIG